MAFRDKLTVSKPTNCGSMYLHYIAAQLNTFQGISTAANAFTSLTLLVINSYPISLVSNDSSMHDHCERPTIGECE